MRRGLGGSRNDWRASGRTIAFASFSEHNCRCEVLDLRSDASGGLA